MAENSAGSIWRRPPSNWAQIASALIASVAVAGVIVQIRIGQHNAQLASAREVYMSYSQAGLQHPELAEPDYAALRQDRLKFIQYKAYVAHMLFAYDEILSLGDQPEWTATFNYDLPDHRDYLCEQRDPRFYAQYYRKMRDLIAEFQATNCG